MKMKTVLVLAFAVGCGLVAMMGVQQMISQQSNADQDQAVTVLVASVDIAPGVLLGPQNSEFKELPARGVPSDAVRDKEQFHDRGMKVPVMAGDIIRMSKLGSRGEIAASASIPPGMRTVSIEVNDTKTHSGLLQPGDRVDLQVTYECQTPERRKQTKSAIFLEYIEVFASGAIRNLEAGESKELKSKNITLLVTPEQANYIHLANIRGELSPIMRSKTDKELVNPDGVDERVLMELQTGIVYDSHTPQMKKSEESVVEETPATPDFKTFLDQQVAIQEPVKAEPEPTPDNSWTITIYAGDSVITQDVGTAPLGYLKTGVTTTRKVTESTPVAPSKEEKKSEELNQDALGEMLEPATPDNLVPVPEKTEPYVEQEPDTRNGDPAI